jgi:hypothetical protein
LEFGKRKNDHRAVLCLIIGQIWRRIEGKTAPLDEEESTAPPSQCAGTPIPRCLSEIGGIGLRIAATSTVISRFSLRDFFLFPNMKKWLGGKRFASDEEVTTETEAYFAVWQILFLEGLKKLESCSAKCIEPKSSYVE